MLGVSVPLPLFDRNQGNLLEALKREQGEDELQALESASTLTVASPRAAGVGSRRDRLLPARGAAENKSASSTLATVGFGYGKFNYLEVLDAPCNYFAPSPGTSRRSPMRTACGGHGSRDQRIRIRDHPACKQGMNMKPETNKLNIGRSGGCHRRDAVERRTGQRHSRRQDG